MRKILWVLLFALGYSGALEAQQWQRLGPEGGMVLSLGAGGDGEVYLGTADGHVFASKDEAESWELRGRVGERTDAVVTRIIADEQRRIFASVWYQEPGTGGGVFESTDEGRSWKLLGLGSQAVRALQIAPSQPDELVAGTPSGVFLSSDAGKSWKRISTEADEELKNLDSLAIDPRDPNVIYAGTYHLPWLTRDAGKTWKPVIAGIIDDSDIMSLRLDSSNPDRVYMSACSGIYRSENQGGAWTKLQGIPYAARRTQVIMQDPESPKTLYAGTTAGLWATHDGGENWALTTSKDWVVNSMVVLPRKNGSARVVLGTASGVEISDDAGVHFREANHGFTHTVVKRLAADPRNAGHLLMLVAPGTGDLRESRDRGKSWSAMPLNTLEREKVVRLNVDEVDGIVGSRWGWMLRLQNGTFWIWNEAKKAWSEWNLTLVETALGRAGAGKQSSAKREVKKALKPSATIAFDANEAAVATSEGMMRCAESGQCARMRAFESKGQVRAFSVAGTGAEIAVVMDGKLGVSSDGGKTAIWRDLPVPMEQVAWLDLATPGNQGSYLGTSRGLFVSRNGGTSWEQGTGGLPAGLVEEWLRCAKICAVSEHGGGLYVSRDDGASWERVDRDAERGAFTGLIALPDEGLLAGSQNEGLLRLELQGSAANSDKH